MSRNIFSPLVITDADGVTYFGARPSQLARPFRQVLLSVDNGKIGCTWPKGHTPVGFDVAANVSMDPCLPSEVVVRYRLVAIMPDGRKWAELLDGSGNLIEEGWL